MPDFNQDQQKAIEAKNPNILVSAAAGSGKTTVMIARIIEELLQTDKTIDQFLVITFTKDAADNMRRKMETELRVRADQYEKMINHGGKGSKDYTGKLSKVKKALQGLESAAISTIHSFCMNTIKEYFDAAGVSSEVKAIDDDLPDQLFATSYVNAVESLFKGENQATKEGKKDILTIFSALKQDEIQQSIKNLHDALMGIPYPFERLEKLIADPEPIWADEVRRAVHMDLMLLDDVACREELFLDNPLTPSECIAALKADIEIIRDFQAKTLTAMDDEQICELLETTKVLFPKLTVRKCPADSKDVYEQIKESRAKLRNAGNIFDSAIDDLSMLFDETQHTDNEQIKIELRGLQTLLIRVYEEYQKAKQEIASVDYSDMEQLTFKLLQDESIRAELMQRYTSIYVDESQDISAIQDAIIQSFRGDGHTIFMVGDIKQSIYRFRHAEPELFDEKRRTYEDGEDAECRRLYFRDNYRTCSNVIDCINEVFVNCMAYEVTELNYEKEDHLKSNKEDNFGPVEVYLLDKGQKDETEDMLEGQCKEVSGIVERLLNEGYHYKDMAILLRSAKTDAPKMVDFFKRLNIPVFYDGPQSFYGLTEIAFFLDLLGSIENDRTDVELYGTLKNLPFSFTDEDLAEIRLQKRDGPFWQAFHYCADHNELSIEKRCRAVRDQLEAWRRRAKELPISDFIWILMRETGFYASRGAYPDGKLRQANLDALYQKSLDLARRGVQRLPDFLEEIHRIQISDKTSSDTPITMGEEDDMVRIMTMHASKGLEFPVVILMNLQKNLRNQNNREQMRIELGTGRPLGVYLPRIDRVKHFKRHTFGKRAFDARAVKNAIAEDTRLLYVAMTRAEQRLFLIGAFNEKDESVWKTRSKLSRLWRTRSMLDMIMPTVLSHVELPSLGNSSRYGEWKLSVIAPMAVEELKNEPSEEFDRLVSEIISEDAGMPDSMWQPEEQDFTPVKTSVTSLVRSAQYATPEEEETVEIKRQPETVLSTFRLSEMPEKPAFMEEEKPEAADIGIATHRFLRLLDLSAFRNCGDYEDAVRSQMAEMVGKRIISDDEAKQISIRNVAVFLRSDLGQRMVLAPEVKREWPFTMQISHDHPTLIQGIIDVAFPEEGGWILLDYKTDRDTNQDSFVARHEMQMNWYRIAVERLTNKPVREMWLVALRGRQVYQVRRVDPMEA